MPERPLTPDHLKNANKGEEKLEEWPDLIPVMELDGDDDDWLYHIQKLQKKDLI